LIMSGKAMAYSAAPLLYGLKNFYKNIHVVGVIFNFVKTESHYQFLKEAAIDAGVTPLGYIPPNDEIKISSRHLGLSIDESSDFDSIIESAAAHISKHIDLSLLLERTACEHYYGVKVDKDLLESIKPEKVMAVARDEAFNFIYPANIAHLEKYYQVQYFSPLRDKKIPVADAVYIAGGYPEIYLEGLSQNLEMKQSIKDFVDDGGKLFAECGGMMYLGEHICDKEGMSFPMCGVFAYDTTMEDMKLHLGYRDISIGEYNIKGHEFHYSHCIEHQVIPSVGIVKTARGKEVNTPIYQYKNCFATYIHMYWAHIDEFFVFNS
ncbi:cobyrinate a,c-diamide synthase, partial [Prolixibacteraceae bacterium]|nr:cobyrinate a,c-diamide synthase [Prolixibacteraceae bacterium]